MKHVPDGWGIVSDSDILHQWKCDLCEIVLDVPPYYYQDSGSPLCPQCDDNMEYDFTIIRDA
jgi:hypothetical protein